MVANGPLRDLLFTGPCARVTVEHQAEPVIDTSLAIPENEIQLPEILGRSPRPVIMEDLYRAEDGARIDARKDSILTVVPI